MLCLIIIFCNCGNTRKQNKRNTSAVCVFVAARKFAYYELVAAEKEIERQV
jgi:hypothetical protein